ncbi:MAG: hypothetical protein QF664_10105 [Dehalococcoidia bacterium]|jgi:hypothetical protein|nr:hypothetical protein [Dehalococcoidia bacterium]
MRSLFAILAAVATGAAIAVAAAARSDVRRQAERHESMPDVTAAPELADA